MAVSLLTNDFVGEFMRFFILIPLLIAGCTTSSGQGLYLYPKSSIEIAEAGRCTTFKNVTSDTLATVPPERLEWATAHTRKDQNGRDVLEVRPCGT